MADLLVVNRTKRELNKEQQKKASKLKKMIADLENDQHVQNRMLETWLSPEEFARIEQYWQQEQDHRNIYKDKPDEVQNYEVIVAKADFYFNRSEHYSLNSNHVQAKKFANMAQDTYEKALERLSEIISLNPGLQIWFDRETESTMDNDIGIDTDTIPRAVTSRSSKCRSGLGKRTIRDVKLGVLEQVLRDLLYEAPKRNPTAEKRNQELLQEMIKLPDDDLI